MVQAAACLVVPHISVRGKDQKVVNAALCVISVVALLGLLFAPLSTVWVWAVLQGIGQGGLIAAAMTNIVLRSPDPLVASDRKSTRLNSVTNAHLVCRLLLENKKN